MTGSRTDAKPREAARLTVTEPSGRVQVVGSPYKNPAAAQGTWRVKAEATGYASEERVVRVPPDEATLEKIELQLLGGLAVTGTPGGAAVKVIGPGGWSDDGGLPAEWTGLTAGTYRVSVTREGYQPLQDLAVTVQPGLTASVPVTLQKQVAGAAQPAAGRMVEVPAGEFFMGCNAEVDTECFSDEKPGRAVLLNAYRIDVHEVTVSEYAACVEDGQCTRPDTGDQCNWSQIGRDAFPVNCVDWNQAAAYCRWVGKRLPTEAEWEKAARGTDGRKFPWGNEAVSCSLVVWGDGIHADGCGKKRAWPVCSKPAGDSPYGLCDMAGNVGEWVQDAYNDDYYDGGNNINPICTSGAERSFRGGSWNLDHARWLRAADRARANPTNRTDSVGFRCAIGAN